jgi:hypothetical protein
MEPTDEDPYIDPWSDDESDAEKLRREKARQKRAERAQIRKMAKQQRDAARKADKEKRTERRKARAAKKAALLTQAKSNAKNVNFKKKESFTITFENTTNGEQEAVIFGCNSNYVRENFGNSTGVQISSDVDGGYLALLNISNATPMTIERWRFECETVKQFENELTYVQRKNNGTVWQSPFRIAADPMQLQSTIRDVEHALVIDGNTEIRYGLLPKTTLTITMFPKEGTGVPKSQFQVTKRGRPKKKATPMQKGAAEHDRILNEPKVDEPLNSHTATNVVLDFLNKNKK